MKRFSLFIFLLATLFISSVLSQSKKDAFLYIEDKPVYPDEFIRLYEKNLNVITDENQKDLDNYLDLFITYKLKLVEAKELELDEDSKYVKDIIAHKKNTILSYLENSKITKEIVEEMYNRSKKEVHVSHILINLPAYAFGKDTIKAYEKIKLLRERALAGEDFNELAVKHSDEPGVEKSRGDLGHFTTMQMVVPFENAAYTTNVDGISPVIRTAFGYHILKVHGERPVKNKIDVSHIMVMKTKDSISDEKRIRDAYLTLQSGKSFADVAKEFSQDEATKDKGGQLEPFGRNDIRLRVFTDTAYSLEENTFSEPFQSDVGWHIVKLNKIVPHPTKTERIAEIKRFFASNRGNDFYNQEKHNKLLSMIVYQRLSHTYIEDLLSVIDRDYLMKIVEPITLSKEKNKELFKLGNHVYYYNDLLAYLNDKVQHAPAGMRTEQILYNAFDDYIKEQALEAYGNKLYREDETYAATIDEYNNGVLLFNLMQEQVWGKAAKDTVAQKEYYNQHQSEFNLPERWEVVVYSTKDKTTAKNIQEKLQSNVDKKEISKGFDIKPVVESWTKESNEMELKSFKSAETLTLIRDGQDYKVVEIQKHTPQVKRDFTLARKDVVQAYMYDFEEQWVKELRKKYKVKLRKKKWKKLKSTLI